MSPYELLVDWSNWGWPLIVNHLWQATLFSLFALAAATSLRRAPASARYFIWLIALIKFALPASFLIFLVRLAGVDVSALTRSSFHSSSGVLAVSPLLSPVTSPATVLRAAETSSHGVEPSAAVMFTVSIQETSHLYGGLTCLWLVGCAFLLVSWLRRRHRLSAALRKGRAVSVGREAEALRRVQSWFGLRRSVRLVITPAISEPGVWRVWRPVMVLPEGVPDQLDDAELEAVFMHEISHIERWDNLVGNLQRVLCCLFWFHPVIWLIDRRLLAEREQACDDTVVRLGGASEVYANGIAKVCRYCLGWDVAGLSKVTGSDLKERVERIISDCAGRKLSALHLTIVGITAAGALTFSVAAGEVKGDNLDTRRRGQQWEVADTRFEDRSPAPKEEHLGFRAPASGDHNPGPQLRKEAPGPAAQTDKGGGPPIEVKATTELVESPPATRSANVVRHVEEILPPEEPPPAPADMTRALIVKASDAGYGDLRRFIGRYEVDPQKAENFVFDITLEHGELWLKPSHTSKRRLIRQSELDLSDAYSDFQFTSILDEKDRVVGLRLNSWGRDVTARKLVLPPPSMNGNTTFRLRGFSDARVVAVAGTFNNWNQSQLLFAREGDEWVCRVKLTPGTYQYKFIVDGNWLTDPHNPRTVQDVRGFINSQLRTE